MGGSVTTRNLRAFVCMLCVSAVAQTPREVWSYTARSNLYAAPIVTDIHPSPGPEILIGDSERAR